ncbi:MAG TPA: hypothetical protein VG734_16770 [Lacunisphaera sp.]|nr:hypothetical protein [Lacunisphaera sp.]
MGFDQHDQRPLMNPQKRTTKVNLWMTVAVAVFFLVGAIAVWMYMQGHAGE